MRTTFFNKFSDHKVLLTFLAAMGAALAMSVGPVLVRLSEVGPAATAFYRFLLSIPLSILWMMMANQQYTTAEPVYRIQDYLLLFTAGSLLALDISIWYLSLNNTTIINSTLLNNMTVIIVPLITWVFLKEKPSVFLVIGVLLSLLGSCILIGHSFTFNMHNLIGDLQAFISALFYSLFMLIIKRLRARFNTPTILFWGALPSIYILSFISYANGEQFFPQSPQGWLYLTGLAVIVHILGQGLLTYAMAHLSAAISALFMSLVPVFSALIGWIILDESLSALQIFGAIVVLIGIIIARETKFLMRWNKRKQ